MNLEELLDAWRVNDAVNIEWLDSIQDDWMEFKPGKGKTIRSNLTHLVSVRKMWLEERFKKEAAAIPKLDWKTATRDEIRPALELSGSLMGELFRKKWESPSKGKLTTALFFAYVISHEANHRAQIEIALRINGHEPDDKFLYGLWEWGNK